MLTAQRLCKSFNGVPVLRNISFGLSDGEKIGLVGANGVGKSTLLRILAGSMAPDSGTVTVAGSTRIAYMPQDLLDDGDSKVGDALRHANTHAAGQGDMSSGDLSVRTDEALYRLGIRHIDESRPLRTLSGGEKTKVSLAAILMRAPDIFLLDEPTNNLDLETLRWLETYLSDSKKTILVASHDRHFLNRVVQAIVEIDEHTRSARRYAGDYDAYHMAKIEEREKWERDYEHQREEIAILKREIGAGRHRSSRADKPVDRDKFARFFKQQRRQTSATRTIRNAQERLNRIQSAPVPRPPKPFRFRPSLRSKPIQSEQVLIAEGLTKAYAGNQVLRDVRLILGSCSRVAITGPNGTGKSTLMRILADQERPDSGTVRLARSAVVGFLPQEPELKGDDAIIDRLRRGLAGGEEDFVFDLVTCGLFLYEELKKKVRELSVGQARKLQIARLIAEEPNVLLLDEPTNHLSFDVLESFEDALAAFEGPMIAVSHDRRFMRKLGESTLQLTEGMLVTADG